MKSLTNQVAIVEVLTHAVEVLKDAKRCEGKLVRVAKILEDECLVLKEMDKT